MSETWGEAVDAELKGIAEGVLVYPFQVLGEMLSEAFSFGSSSSGGSDDHRSGGCYCNCRDHK